MNYSSSLLHGARALTLRGRSQVHAANAQSFQHRRCVSLRARIFAVLAVVSQCVSVPSLGQVAPEALKRADTAFHTGYAALSAGNLEVARTQFATVVRLAPQIPEGHEALGEVLIELNHAADAAVEFETALKLKPGDLAIQANLAQSYAKAGKPANAIPYFKAVFDAPQQPDPPLSDAAFCEAYARALAAVGNQSEAIGMFQAAVQRGGASSGLFDAIGSLYAQSGNWAQARPQFERALAIDNSNILAHVHLGIVQREQHDLAGSLASLDAAASGAAFNPLVEFEYGRTFEAGGKDDAAIPHLERAATLDPAMPGAENELAMALQREGRQQEAIPWFKKAIQRDPTNVSSYTNLGLALTLTGKAMEALPLFQHALAVSPRDPTIYKDQGVAHVQLSAFDEAIGDFQAALALNPDDPQLHYDLGMAYKFKDRIDDAVSELTKAGQMDPTLQDPPYTLGILYMQIGKLDQAVTELNKAVTLRPRDGDAWAILGSTLKQDSRLDEARAALEKAIPLLPNQPGPRVTLAGVLAEQAGAAAAAADAAEATGDHEKADKLRAQVKELRAQAAEYRRQSADLSRIAVNRQKATFALNAGNQLLLRGQIAEAVARYQESIAADATFADAHAQLAVAFDRLGRATDAASERAKAAQLTPSK